MRWLLFVVMGLMICGAAFIGRTAVSENSVMALVNDETITQREFEENFYPEMVQRYKAMVEAGLSRVEIARTMATIRQERLQEMIIDKLLLQIAGRSGIQVLPEYIEKELEKKAKAVGGKKELEKILVQRGKTIFEFRKELEKALIVRFLLIRKVRYETFVSPKETKEWYDSHVSEFWHDEKIQARIIFLDVKKRAPEEALKLAAEIETKIRAGEDFSTLAQKNSDDPSAAEGGLLKNRESAFVDKSALPEKVTDIAFTQKTSEPCSKPIVTPAGVYLLKVEVKQEKGFAPLTDATVQKQIREDILRNKFYLAQQKWVKEQFKEAYVVMVSPAGEKIPWSPKEISRKVDPLDNTGQNGGK